MQKSYRRLFLFFCIAFTLNLTSKAQSENSQSLTSIFGKEISFADFDAFLEEEMEAYDIPGASIAIINEGKVVYHRVKGYSEEGEKVQVDEQTIFEGASISKSVFAYFVMSFVEEGKLDLDKPLYLYMPYPDIAHDERYKKITGRMVLSHRSGFPNWRTDTPGDSLFIQFEPGNDYYYSGEGYQYLAKVLAHILGTDDKGLSEVFQERVAKPLGMKHTRFIQDEYNKQHKAQPYVDGDWLERRDMGEVFGAAFSIHSEALDFSNWLIEGLINGKGLSDASFEELFTPHSELSESEVSNKGSEAYGLGFMILETPFGTGYGHGGNNLGFTSLFYVQKEQKWGFILFTNSEYGTDMGFGLATYAATGDPEFFENQEE